MHLVEHNLHVIIKPFGKKVEDEVGAVHNLLEGYCGSFLERDDLEARSQIFRPWRRVIVGRGSGCGW